MKKSTSILKLMLLSVMVMVAQAAFAGGSSSSAVTVSVSNADTGKGYVYVSTQKEKPAADEINESKWWNISSFPQNTMVDNDTHYYHVAGMATEGYHFAGIKQVIEEGVYGDLIPADEEGWCEVVVQCEGPANSRVYEAVFDAVTKVNGVNAIKSEGRTFNLQGQQVGKGAKGIVIREGKKVVAE